MTSFLKALSLSSLFLLLACAPTGEVERSIGWKLNPAESGMSYVTIKNGNLGEINTFREISGSVSTDGKAEFIIALDSVDTDNERRDGRMKEFLFQTDQFPKAKVVSNLDMAQFNTLAIGDSVSVLLDMSLNLHGVENSQEFYVLVTRLGANKVRVDNKAPLLIDGDDFGFETGLAKLQELAMLNSITPVVSATISLTFER